VLPIHEWKEPEQKEKSLSHWDKKDGRSEKES
jgi:hypothetical protein